MSDAIQITIVGMTLVFGAILLLWALMAALVKLTEDAPIIEEVTPAPVEEQLIHKKQVAVMAVAIALAKQPEIREFPLPPTPLVTAWQAVKRTSMMQKRNR